MNKIKIYINDNEYLVDVATTDEEKEQGLQGREELSENEGMLFINETPESCAYWMKDCVLSLDIIFIDEYWDVIDVAEGKPNCEDLIECDNVKYVLELNANSGIKVGDEVDLSELEEEDSEESSEEEEDDEDYGTMIVIGPRGKPQVELKGGERIFSRPNTKTLIRIAKRGYKSKKDSDYKALGRKIFEYIKTQNGNDPEYVEIKD